MKNDFEYKSSPQIELMSNLESATFYPMIKIENKYEKYFTPKPVAEDSIQVK